MGGVSLPHHTLPLSQLYDSMSKPAFIFDGRNILDHAKLREIGFIVFAIGKPLDPVRARVLCWCVPQHHHHHSLSWATDDSMYISCMSLVRACNSNRS